jgi:hypothetical protein
MCTWLREIIFFWLVAGGVQPAGFQSAGGTRIASAPIDIEMKYAMPSTTKVSATPMLVALRKWFINATDKGAAIIAPPPKPMIAMPVAIPRRSGNQRINVDTGDT